MKHYMILLKISKISSLLLEESGLLIFQSNFYFFFVYLQSLIFIIYLFILKRVLSLGPRKFGPNVLVNNLPNIDTKW